MAPPSSCFTGSHTFVFGPVNIHTFALEKKRIGAEVSAAFKISGEAGTGSGRSRVGPRHPHKEVKRGWGGGTLWFVSSYVTQKFPNSQMWRAIRSVLDFQINKQRKMKVRKDRPGPPLIVLRGGSMRHVAKANLFSQFPQLLC